MIEANLTNIPESTIIAPYLDARVLAFGEDVESSVFSMRVDTGADITVVPKSAVSDWHLLKGITINTEFGDGRRKQRQSYMLRISLNGKIISPENGIFLTNGNNGWLGIDVLQHFDMELSWSKGKVILHSREGDRKKWRRSARNVSKICKAILKRTSIYA